MLRRMTLFSSLLLIVAVGSIALSGPVDPVSAQSFGTSPWTAQFYTFSNPSDPVGSSTAIPGGTATFNALNFNWGTGSPPVAGVPADNFRAVFQSTQTLTPGTYTFTVNADDRARLLINNVEVIHVTMPGQTQSAQYVVAGGAVFMTVDYIEFTSTAYLQVQWTVAGGAATPYGPTGTPLPTATPTVTALPPIPPGAITATVIRADILNVRSAPSLSGIRIGQILKGQTYAVVGRDEDAYWFLLQLGGYQGWAWGYYLYIYGNEFTIPVVSPNAAINLAGMQDTGVRAVAMATMRLRAEPSVASAQIGRIPWGTTVPVVGRTRYNTWYQVVWWNTVGWVYAPYLRIVDGYLANAPIR